MKLPSSYPALLLFAILLFVNDAVSQSPSPTAPFTTTLFSTNVFSVNGQPQTQVVTITSVIKPASPSPTNNGNGTGSSNNSGNQTTHSSTPTNFPTANPKVDGGGNPGGLAPSPGGGGGLYGPNDNFIAGALALQVNVALISLVGVAIGAMML